MDPRLALTLVSAVAELAVLFRRVKQLPLFHLYVFVVFLRHGIWLLGPPTSRAYLQGYTFSGWILIGFQAAMVLELIRVALSQYPGIMKIIGQIAWFIGGSSVLFASGTTFVTAMKIKSLYGILLLVLTWSSFAFGTVSAIVAAFCLLCPVIPAVRLHGWILAAYFWGTAAAQLIQARKILTPEVAGALVVAVSIAAYVTWALRMPQESWTSPLYVEPTYDVEDAQRQVEDILDKARRARAVS